MEYLKSERGDSPLTVEAYANDLAEFQKFLDGQGKAWQWTTVEADDIREWVICLLDGEKLSATSVRRKLSALRTYYRYLRRMGWVSANPMEKVVAPKKKRKLPSFVREAEMDRLLEMTAEDRTYKGIMERLVLMMFYETGIRRAELLGLTDASVDLSAKQIKVTGKRNKQRLVPFGGELEREIRAYIKARNEHFGLEAFPAFFVCVNGKPMNEGTVSHIVKTHLAKVTTAEKKSPHVLRHSFATAMLNNHADLGSIQKLLGHESVATTEIYTHVSFEDLKSAYKTAHPRR